jgi:hypothetical protein
MVKQESKDSNDQLTAKVEALKHLKEHRTIELKKTMQAIRTSIHTLTDGDVIELKEPINFNAIIHWTGWRNGVMLFLGGDYSEGDTAIQIRSLAAKEDGEEPKEILNITVFSQDDHKGRTLVIGAGKSLSVYVNEGNVMTDQVEAAKEDINSSYGDDPISVFHRIDLASDAVQFARQALLREVTAIDARARARNNDSIGLS